MPQKNKDANSKKTIKQIHLEKVSESKLIKAQIKKELRIMSDSSYYDIVLGRKILNEGEKIIVAKAYNVNIEDVAWVDKTDKIV